MRGLENEAKYAAHGLRMAPPRDKANHPGHPWTSTRARTVHRIYRLAAVLCSAQLACRRSLLIGVRILILRLLHGILNLRLRLVVMVNGVAILVGDTVVVVSVGIDVTAKVRNLFALGKVVEVSHPALTSFMGRGYNTEWLY